MLVFYLLYFVTLVFKISSQQDLLEGATANIFAFPLFYSYKAGTILSFYTCRSSWVQLQKGKLRQGAAEEPVHATG